LAYIYVIGPRFIITVGDRLGLGLPGTFRPTPCSNAWRLIYVNGVNDKNLTSIKNIRVSL